MSEHLEEKRLASGLAVSVAAVIAFITCMITALMFWSTHVADAVALDRQKRLVETVLERSVTQIAHDQEASTYWDDAVEHLQAPRLDTEWLDANLGVWFHTYYGHDDIFIVNGSDRPI